MPRKAYSDLMQARAQRSVQEIHLWPPSSSAPLVTSPNTLANGRQYHYPRAGEAGAARPAQAPGAQGGGMGGGPWRTLGPEVTAAYPHTTQQLIGLTEVSP